MSCRTSQANHSRDDAMKISAGAGEASQARHKSVPHKRHSPCELWSRLRTLCSKGKLIYITLNIPAPCPPRSVVPVNSRAWFGEFVSSQHARFAFGQGCDCPSYVNGHDGVLQRPWQLNSINADAGAIRIGSGSPKNWMRLQQCQDASNSRCQAIRSP